MGHFDFDFVGVKHFNVWGTPQWVGSGQFFQ
jgi:hypothetical protein